MLNNSNNLAKTASLPTTLPKPDMINREYELALFIRSNYLGLSTNLKHNQLLNTNKIETVTKCKDKEECTQSFQDIITTQSIFMIPEFKLTLKSPLDAIYKGKYFSFSVELKTMRQCILPQLEYIELEMMIYSSDNILISKNMCGRDILKGNYIQKMKFGQLENQHIAYFRVQITEVSSHFIGKIFNIKIKARKSHYLKATGWKVQSLTIPGVVVKAKKNESKSIMKTNH